MIKNKFHPIRLFTLLFFGSLVLGQFQRYQLGSNIAFYLHDILLASILIGSISYFKKTPKIPPKYEKFYSSINFFYLALISSYIISIITFKDINIIGGMYLARFIFYSSTLIIFYILKSQKVIKNSLYPLLLFMGSGLAFTGLFQRFFYPDTRNFTLLGWDDHLYRSIGSLMDPNFLGIMIILTIILSINTKHKYKRFILPLLFLTLLLTYSRSSFVSFIAAGVTLGLQKSSKKIIGFTFIAILVGALLLPRPGGEGVRLERTASIFSRIESQQNALELFYRFPIFGIGFNNYKTFVDFQNKYDFVPNHPSGPDNSFLLILITTGVLGFFTFIYLLYQLFISFHDSQLILPSLVAIGTHSLFNNTLFYPWIIIWVFTLLSEELTRART